VTDGADDSLLVELAVALARRWRTVVAVPAVAGAVATILVLLTPNSYRAVTSFVPEARGRSGPTGSLAGLAAAAGISLGTTDPGESPQFYVDLLTSTPIVYAVLQTRFAGLVRRADTVSGDSLALVDFVQPGSDPLAERLERAAQNLRGLIDVTLNHQTGVVRLGVMARSPALAAAIAEDFVRQLNIFNRDSRQSKARVSRVFAEAQVADAERALASAEEALRTFSERNRTIESPGLRFEQGRLDRQVQIQQQLYITLRAELASSRIREADESPALTVIEHALAPTHKAAPNRRRTVLGVMLAALALSASWVVFYEMRSESLRAFGSNLWSRVGPLLSSARARRATRS
jgi:uncharacterized protein involved in exopolysaccharide biosynthesis